MVIIPYLSNSIKILQENFAYAKCRNINSIFIYFTELYSKSNNLAAQSAQFRKDATSLNATSWVAIGAGLSVLFIVFFFWYKFLL